MYISIPEQFLYVIDLLHNKTDLIHTYIYLTLTKLKMNDTFSRLSDEFGISASHVNRIFNKSVPLIANCLRFLIFWPKKDTIPFRARYSIIHN